MLNDDTLLVHPPSECHITSHHIIDACFPSSFRLSPAAGATSAGDTGRHAELLPLTSRCGVAAVACGTVKRRRLGMVAAAISTGGGGAWAAGRRDPPVTLPDMGLR